MNSLEATADELEALQKAGTIREYRFERLSAIQQAIDNTPRPETRAAIGEFVEALTRGVPYRVSIETRSVTTAVAGARASVASESLGAHCGCGRTPPSRFIAQTRSR
jgi:hypothetical protein